MAVKPRTSEQDLHVGTRTQLKPRLGSEPTLFPLDSLTWCPDLLRLRFFVSQLRRDSARGKVIEVDLLI